MKNLAALLAVAALAGCAEPPRPGGGGQAHAGGNVTTPADPASDPAVPAACTIVIAFGSYAMGIDRDALRRVEALLAGDSAVTGVTRSGWGREGELTLCAAIRSDADRDRLFAAVAALLPRRPVGPVSVRTNDGREFQANNGT